MPFGLDEHGRPIFLISTMAMHTQNLKADPRASLLIVLPDAGGDPLGASRVTLVGNVLPIPQPEVADARNLYLRIYASDYVQSQPDPLADSMQEIIQHMNADHKDVLVLLARRFAQIEAQEATMTAVDRLGFHLRVKTLDGIRGVRIAFLREVRNAEESRTVLIEMVQQARSNV